MNKDRQMEYSLPFISALTASVIVVLQLTLMMLVGFKRLGYNQGLGDGGHGDLLMAIRRHGNLAENAALFVVTLALVELIGGSSMVVVGLGIAFVFVRFSHAIGLTISDGPTAPRAIGAFGTLIVMGGAALYLAFLVYTSL